MTLVFYLSSQPAPLPDLTGRLSDKLLHVLEYAALAWLFCRALVGEGLRSTPALGFAMLLASLYGASDEWHQRYVPERTFEITDWMADTVGAAAGAVAYSLVFGSPRALPKASRDG
jgi:VanZ family protein